MLADEMILFYHVVRLKSFSQAAENLKVSKAFVSKHITQLEKELKTRLLARNTRQLKLTEAGELFYTHCAKLFALAEQSYEDMAHLRNQPTGTLKISAPPALALHLLAKPLAEYQIKYPEVRLNIVLESHLVDLIPQGYDLAIRSAFLADSSLVARKLMSINYFLCATPEYLKKNGPIDHPDQLAHHAFAVYGTDAAMQTFEFIRGTRSFHITVESRFQSNQLDLVLQMVMASHCIAVFPEFMVAAALAKKQLTICLTNYRLPSKPLYVIYPQREYIPLRVKAFIDLLSGITFN